MIPKEYCCNEILLRAVALKIQTGGYRKLNKLVEILMRLTGKELYEVVKASDILKSP